MTQTRQIGKNVLHDTLEKLDRLYKDNHIQPGNMIRVGITPQWIMVTGSEHECGIARNVTGIFLAENNPSGYLAGTYIQKKINRPLFEVADTGIQSDDLLERSLGTAALSALSQHFLSCSAVRKRGYLSQCWKAIDPFVLQYPMMSRIITMDDVVVNIGHGGEVRGLRGMCRELHVIDTHSSDTFRMALIDSSITYGPANIVIHSGEINPDLLSSADVVCIDAFVLVDGTFEYLMRHTGNARLVGLCGLSGSLIPDAFFEQGVDFVSSFRITDPCGFIDAMANEYDMEYAFKTGQKQYLMMRPSAIAARPGAQNIFTST